MAAFLQLASAGLAPPMADAVRRLGHAVQENLTRHRDVRPTLICRWLQDTDGRLSCHWDIDLPDLPVPPD